MKPILEIRGVSKKFDIRHSREPYLSLRDKLSGWLSFERSTSEEFWALQDISFDVEIGGSVGIIGRNGAGKSTLLKILSKITPPTKGKIISRGRIASLLEVGTGFHPELTGRENIYLNGSILGMKKTEIGQKFDEIVEFAGTEKFLDTPLKHYSSGMQLRLAFAVAAFLEPEILVIDEVLAVGDAEFQKKCLVKMEDVAKGGRTILFVSHNLGMIRQLCKTGVLLDKGRVIHAGDMNTVVDVYQRTISRRNSHTVMKEINGIVLEEVQIHDAVGTEESVVSFGSHWEIRMKIHFKETLDQLCVAVGLIDSDERSVRTHWHAPTRFAAGQAWITFSEKNLIIAEGTYRVVIGFSFKSQAHAYFDEGIFFEIMRTMHSKTVFDKFFYSKTDSSTGIVYNPFEVTIEQPSC